MGEHHLQAINSSKVNIKEDRIYEISKRVFDITASVIGLLVLLPLLIVIGVLIKYEDRKGKILFKQIRIGKDGQEFYMYKFRSMVSDAEEKITELLKYNEIEGAMFKMKNDPRVTNIGKIIRKTSLDELPQLWNVLRGEMSLVGPRPPLPREVKEYNSYHKQRLLVTPGCTGLWQVCGRNEVGFEEMVKLDIDYIENRNLYLDLKLIFATIISMVYQKGL